MWHRVAVHVAVPAYFGPWERAHWAQLLTNRPRVVVINPDTGPGSRIHSGYRSLISQMLRGGTTVLGYVPTTFGQRPIDECRADADRYLASYGTSGVFFDEINVELSSLRRVSSLAHGFEHVGFNPGRTVPEEFRQALSSAMWVTFEGTARQYLDRAGELAAMAPHPRDCHLVHSIPSSLRVRVERTLKRHQPGFAYLTADRMPNPWDVFDSGNDFHGDMCP